MEWIELRCGDVTFPGESPEKLLANLKRLRDAVERGSTSVGEPSGFWPLPMPPGDDQAGRLATLDRMIAILQRTLGKRPPRR